MTTTLLDADGNPPTIRRGEAVTFLFPVSDHSVSPAVPKNLTGATEATFSIAFDRSTAVRDLMLTLGDGVTHDDDGGIVTVTITALESEELPSGNRWCELWITDAAGRREVVGEGRCLVHDTLVTVP